MSRQQKYWQVAAGSDQRDYSQAFLDYGIAFVGGPANIAVMEQVEVGHVLLLKSGTSELRAVGRVVERGGTHKGNAERFSNRSISSHIQHDNPYTSDGNQGLNRSLLLRCHYRNTTTLLYRNVFAVEAIYSPYAVIS